ncbi:MAG: glycosyltransferase [Elusimicrobiota bacterium]|nr:glycosyltransferase [Elusimicrobiota bacterium]
MAASLAGVSVVIPTYEERETVEPLLRRLDAALAGRPREYIVVDDGSPDGTAEAVRRAAGAVAGVRLVENPGRGGIGAALRRGCDLAAHEFIASLDADLSFAPEDLPRLLERLDAGADLALGGRHHDERAYEATGAGTRLKRALSRLGNAAAARLLGLPQGDLTANFRAIRREAWRRLDTRETGNAMLIETALQAARLGLRVEQVPVTFRERRHGRSKLRPLRECCAVLRLLARAGSGR